MSKRLWCIFAGTCVSAMSTLYTVPAIAQATEVKEKPALYSYIANWQIPRAHWAEMEKADVADKVVLDKALADGMIVGFGNDEYIVHTVDGETHDNWWSSMSMAGLIKVLDQISANGNNASSVLTTSTKHWDEILVSRFYNWKSGSFKDGYVRIAAYKLRANAPDDAVETLSKQFFVPLLEKLLADGTIREYEIDTEAVHTESPDTFSIVFVASSPESLDKVDAAIADAVKGSPLTGPAFYSMVDFSAHRDQLAKGQGTYK